MFSPSFFQKLFLGVFGTLLLLGLAYSVIQQFSSSSSIPLETASFVDRSGKSYTFHSFQGKPLVVNIWASWCGPCVAEMPTLDDLALKMRAKGGDVLTIIVEPLIGKAIASFARKNIQNLVPYHDAQGQVSEALHVSGLPLTVFIDEEGHEVFRFPGALNWNSAEASALIRQHLKIDL